MRRLRFRTIPAELLRGVRSVDDRLYAFLLACGHGRVAQYLRRAVERVIGVERAHDLGKRSWSLLTPARLRKTHAIRAGRMHVVHGLHACPTCGLFQTLPDLAPGHVAYCRRCDEPLKRRRRTPPLSTPMAFCMTSFALYIALLSANLMTLNAKGRVNTISIISGVSHLFEQGYGEIGTIVALTTFIMPGIVIVLMGLTLYAVSRGSESRRATPLLKWYQRLREWAMIEVYILGVFVAYTKLVDLALVSLQPGVYLVAVIMITMAATDSTFDVERIWHSRRIDQNDALYRDDAGALRCIDVGLAPSPPSRHMASCLTCGLVVAAEVPVAPTEPLGACPRCGTGITRRKPNSLVNASCLLLAGIIAYIPANLFPVMTYVKIGRSDTSTIIHGAIELWQSNLVPLSLLVIFASICVPVLKIVGLGTMVLGAAIGLRSRLRFLTKLYRVIDVIGRWSMIDVFMISILVAVVRFGFLANVRAEPGVIFFTFVVIVTIFAVHCFDIRCLWDAAGKNGPDLARLSSKGSFGIKTMYWRQAAHLAKSRQGVVSPKMPDLESNEA